MGCDIHMYVEYKGKEKSDKTWRSFGGRINPGRDYWMFGILSKGVRGDVEGAYVPKGFPENQGYNSFDDYYYHIVEEEDDAMDKCVSYSTAMTWVDYGSNIIYRNKVAVYVSICDWHSTNYLSTEEFANAINIYKNLKDGQLEYKLNIKYQVVLAAMTKFEENGYDARILFWFDN